MDLILNKEKFGIFLETAKVLNRHNIIPILFGSLGLNRVIGEFAKANDIDVLISDKLISQKWNDLIEIMKKLNFRLKDKKEHEFIKDSEIVAFGKESDLLNLSQINPDTLNISEINGVKFKELSAEQYLLCYQLMFRDKYRQEKRGKADREKIALIQKYLENKKYDRENLSQ